MSAFSALCGGPCLVLASDLGRYRPLLRSPGVAFASMRMVFLFIDLAAGMPCRWTASEGPGSVVVGVVLVWLARP